MSVIPMPSKKSNLAPAVPFHGKVHRSKPPRSEAVVRRGTPEQGRALEALGHAVEYLVDSRLFMLDQAAVRSDDEAVQIMMRLSRAVFAECPEVVTLRRKVRLWVVERLAGLPSLDEAR